jgi:transposase
LLLATGGGGTSDYAALRQGGGDWRKVIWSDEAIFETWRNGRIWVTRRVDEKRCPDCIKSVYRSGRVTVMIWGALGWDWKSPLVFLEKELGHKGVTSRVYKTQVLESIVAPLFDQLGTEYIFMEDGAKIHKGYARLIKLQHNIRGFDWPPSSPDLNVIEKVWRWMKEELKKLPFVPTTKEELKRQIQRLWDMVDPRDYRRYTKRLTCKLEDLIAVRGLAIIH